jgi:hypothetical protein
MAKKPVKAVQGDSEVRIQLVPLTHLQKWPRNPKGHDIPAIKQSIAKFGFVQPIVLDEGTSRMVAGHGRLEALIELHRDGAALPKRIVQQGDGEWLVPVLRGVVFASEREAEEYLLVDNRLVEKGGWTPVIGPIFTEYVQTKYQPIGWTPDEVTHLAAKYMPTEDMSGFAREEFEAPTKDGKPKPDGNWFYVEYYGDDARFTALKTQLAPVMRTGHEVLHDVFEEMVRLWLQAHPGGVEKPVKAGGKGKCSKK